MTRRLSVSLPDDLVAFAEQRAKQRGLTVSAIVAEGLRKMSREDRNRRIMVERAAEYARLSSEEQIDDR